MDYLDKFYNTINEFLIKLGLKDYLIDLPIGRDTIELTALHMYDVSTNIHNNISLLERELSKIDNSIRITLLRTSGSTVLEIRYSSNKKFDDKEMSELDLYYFIKSRFYEDYDIQRIFDMGRNLQDYYPFNLGISFDFHKYQREVIKNLTDKQLSFYLKLMNDIDSKKILNQQPIVIFESSGFIFYKGNDNKVKTLIFNER